MDTIESHDHHEFAGNDDYHGGPIEDDPHRAAIEDNPEKPAKMTTATVIAVFVSTTSKGDEAFLRQLKLTFASSSWACHQSHPSQLDSSLRLRSWFKWVQILGTRPT